MGLGLQLHVPRDALHDRSWTELRDAIGAYARQPNDELLERLVDTGVGDGLLYVTLHPAEESVVFHLGSSGDLVCDAKTTNAGPGYHAYLVEWLEGLGESLGVTWRDDGPDGGDETGYWAHRDFGRLQAAVAEWLVGLSGYLVENIKADEAGERTPFFLGLPIDAALPAAPPADAVSSVGYWDRAFFEAVVGAEGDALHALADRYFPWWREGRDAGFWDGVARVIAWSSVPWHAAANDAERELYQLVLDCFDRVRHLDPARVLPEGEIAELRSLCSETDMARAPSPEGIGFRRQDVVERLPGGWRARLPGYFYTAVENEGTTEVYWFAERTVRVSSWSFGPEDGRLKPAEEVLAGLDPPEGAMWHRERSVIAFASLVHEDGDEDEDPYWRVDGRAAAPGSLCAATICFEDPADEAWGLEVWRSLAHPAPPEAPVGETN